MKLAKKKATRSRNRFEGCLPDGTVASNGNKYAKAWREFTRPFFDEFGWVPYGYEPGISFWIGVDAGPVSWPAVASIFHLNLSLARKFRDLIVEVRARRKKEKV